MKNGHKKPYELKPYAIWNYTTPFDTPANKLYGLTADLDKRLIYIVKADADGPPNEGRALPYVLKVR